MATLPTTLANLDQAIRQAFDVLSSRPELHKTLEFYQQGRLSRDRILRASLKQPQGRSNLQSLLRAESIIVRSAYDAGCQMAEFRKKRSKEPTKAIESLTKFGSKLTEAFNKQLRSIYGGEALRPLGTMVFAAAALAFATEPSLKETKPKAMLALSVLKEDAKFTLADFAKHQIPTRDDVVLEERLVSLA